MSIRGGLDFLVHRLRRAAGGGADGASDASLLERFVAGRDEAAFELLLWRHGPMVLSVCRRMLRCGQDAEDAFQTAFLLLARKASSIRRREAVAGWLYQTACRIALRARAAARKRRVAVLQGTATAGRDADPDLIWRDLRPVLDEEVNRLPAKYRMAIILCYFQGRTHAQAAQELGCPRGAVAMRLQRARDLLRGRLTRRGLALSVAALAVLAVERTASAAAPAALVHATLKAALLSAAGKAVTGAVSAQAAAWTQGALRSMFLSKLKMLAAVTLLVGAIGTGTGLLMSVTAAPQSPASSTPSAAARPADDGKAVVEVPAEREGRLVLVGTEIKPGETIPEKDKVVVKVGFLAVEVGDKNDPKFEKVAPEKWWADLDPTGAKAYARWREGDALPAGKLFVAREEREYRKLHVGDAIEEGQLLGMVDQGPALDEVAVKIAKLETAEADHKAAGATKGEAARRATQAEFLYSKGKGYIGEDDYQAALLNRGRYIEEEKSKKAGCQVASAELSAALAILKLYEIRSSERGIVKEILKRRGEAIHKLEAIVRLEVQDAPPPPAEKRAIVPPALLVVNVACQRDGLLLVVGTEIKEGEKVPADRIVVVKTGEETKSYRRLCDGDPVEEGQLLARVDDRLARLDVEVRKDKLDAAEAELRSVGKTKDEADMRYQRLRKLQDSAAVPEEEVRAAKLASERFVEEEKVKTAAVRQARAELQTAQIVLEMYEVHSPVRGVVKAVCKSRGEAVKSLETIVQIQEKAKE
jgi:RNA polymerase sigma factor (sigma-70 family)